MTHLSPCLGDEEISESASKETECRKENVRPPFNSSEHVGSNETDDTIDD
jgi:hypothetical protein